MDTLKYTQLVVALARLAYKVEHGREISPGHRNNGCLGCQRNEEALLDLLREHLTEEEFKEVEKMHAANLGPNEVGTEFRFGQQRCYNDAQLFESLASWQYLKQTLAGTSAS